MRLVATFGGSIHGSRLIALKLKPNFPLDAKGKKRCHSTMLFTWKLLKNTGPDLIGKT